MDPDEKFQHNMSGNESPLSDYYLQPALAFIISELGRDAEAITMGKKLSDLNATQKTELLKIGLEKKLRLHPFKKTMGLARVSKVIGYLRAFQPQNLLDVGSGRGVFLWPMLEAFPGLDTVCIDLLAKNIDRLAAIRAGGLSNLSPRQVDICSVDYPDEYFDLITVLETLEHIPSPDTALKNALRMAGRALILSVPSKEDDNPDHIHLLDRQFFIDLLHGDDRVSMKFDYVLNHMLVIIVKRNRHG